MGVFLATLHFLDNQRSVKSLTHLSRSAPLKSGPSEIDLTPLRGRRGTETRTSWACICLRERVPDIATCFAGSGGFLCDSRSWDSFCCVSINESTDKKTELRRKAEEDTIKSFLKA